MGSDNKGSKHANNTKNMPKPPVYDTMRIAAGCEFVHAINQIIFEQLTKCLVLI